MIIGVIEITLVDICSFFATSSDVRLLTCHNITGYRGANFVYVKVT